MFKRKFQRLANKYIEKGKLPLKKIIQMTKESMLKRNSQESLRKLYRKRYFYLKR